MGVPPNKSFWNKTEMDMSICTEALVSIYRFLPATDSIPVFLLWLEAERSEAVKCAAIRACLTLLREVRPVFSTFVSRVMIELCSGRTISSK